FARRSTASVRLGVPVTLAPPAGVRTRGGCSYKAATPERGELIESDRGPWARRSQAACTPGAQRTRATPTRAGATPGRTSTSSSVPQPPAPSIEPASTLRCSHPGRVLLQGDARGKLAHRVRSRPVGSTFPGSVFPRGVAHPRYANPSRCNPGKGEHQLVHPSLPSQLPQLPNP